MIDALRAIPAADRPAAIDATAREYSRQAAVIDAIGLALFILGAIIVWVATP